MTARLRTPGDDSGASLIIAMIFVTLVGMVSGVLLSFADTGVDTTIQLRKQSADATTADGAAEVAIDALREGSYSNATGQSCFGSSSGLSLTNFPATGGSAFVACAPDKGSGSASTGTLNASNTPANAILSLGGVSSSESGVQVTATAADNAMVVKGGVFSDSAITVTPGTLRSDTSIVAQSNLCNPASAMTSPNTNCSSTTPQADPNYAAASGALTARTVPTCTAGTVVTFSPGLYTDAAGLSKCDNVIMAFTPGTYYFNFPSTAPTWTVDTGSLVGGTPASALVAGQSPTIPGSCISPLTSTTVNQGVQFVFGGLSRMDVRGTARAELCGSYSATAPPVAVYGLKSAVGTVPALNGCMVTQAGCPMITSSDQATGSALFVQGTVYAPTALVVLSYQPSAGQVTGDFVKDGMIVRSVTAQVYGLSPTGIEVPTLTAGPKGAETDVFLQVYLCPGVATCSAATGRLRLESKVGVSTAIPVVPGVRSVRVYSWATQR
ncbi:MAG: hypothetical protein QOK30_988 [Nocardioidaceae bacterium]|jgi:hypothetical protein|nr:hypothetical protein [Nocardioidaceae bacterium]